jgi:large subunit ribosomal protein L30
MFAVVRIRGTAQVRKTIEDTLNFLRLKRVNNCVLIPETKEYIGMLKKAKDYITWGSINKETLTNLIQHRCKVVGDKKIDEKLLKEITGIETFEKFSETLIKEKIKVKDYKQIKQVFKLNPPRHGFKGTKLPFPKGDLGNRKEKINELIERMI